MCPYILLTRNCCSWLERLIWFPRGCKSFYQQKQTSPARYPKESGKKQGIQKWYEWFSHRASVTFHIGKHNIHFSAWIQWDDKCFARQAIDGCVETRHLLSLNCFSCLIICHAGAWKSSQKFPLLIIHVSIIFSSELSRVWHLVELH